MIGTVLNGRYRLDAELGQGGTGIVYRAYDELLERNVAVKVLSASTLGSEGRARLLHEAQAAAKLNHPNIISIYDAGEANRISFIIMELLEGKSLYVLKPERIEDILEISRQICIALEHAHAHGVIHRDLKPENVMVSPEGVVKLTDFGLARSVASRFTVEGAIIGTVFYISPEQAMGQAIDGRADLYSLGVILYELSTRRLPFAAEDPLAVISQHLYAPVVPPSAYNPEVHPALDALIVKLLSKSAEDRPASAVVVRRALESMVRMQSLDQALPVQQVELSPLEQLVRGRLVGRERELDTAKQLWNEARYGSGERHVLLISGESGVGKSPLVRAIQTYAGVTGGLTLTGNCYSEGTAPYAPVALTIREALSLPGVSLPHLVLADLITMAPDLRLRYPQVPPNQPLDPLADRQRLFDSVVAVYTTLAERSPLLLIIEDIQWADGGTLALLRYLARRSRSARLPLLLVLTYRESEITESQSLNELFLDLGRERLAERIKLSRLDQEQTGRLLSVMLQEEVAPELLEAIYQETEGNQFFVEELVKALVEQGRLYRQEGRWRWKDMEEVQLPQSVRLTVQSRVAKLPPQTQEILRLASIIGRDFDFDTLRQASDLDEDILIDALENAEHAQMIVEVKIKRSPKGKNGRVRFAFAHGLITTALRDSVSGLRRNRLHRRIAAAIEALRPDDYEALAYHYGMAGDEESARINYLRAADRALQVYSSEEAIRFYTEALGLIPVDHPDRFDALAARAKVYDLLARRQEQQTDVSEMLALAEKEKNDARRFDALIALADFYLATDHVRAQEPAERAASIAQDLKDPVREGLALRRLGWGAFERFDFIRCRSAIEAAVERFREAGQLNEAATCLSMLALIYGYLGELPASREAIEEALALSRSVGDRRQEAINLRRLATHYIHHYQAEKGLPHAEEALALHRELGDRSEECHALNVLGLIYSHMSQPETARSFYLQSLEKAESIGLSIGISNAISNLIWIYYYRLGELEAALAFLTGQLNKAKHANDKFLVRNILNIEASLYDNLGHYRLALEIKQKVLPLTTELFNPGLQAGDLGHIAILQAQLGQFTQAQEGLNLALEQALSTGNPYDAIDIHNNFGYYALIVGETESLNAGLEHLRQAIDLSGNFPEPLSYSYYLAGRIYLALGEPAHALDCLTEAIRIMQPLIQPIPREQYWFAYSQALRASGKVIDADDFLRQAYEQVELVVNRTLDEALKRSWLENVSINRDIIASWTASQAS